MHYDTRSSATPGDTMILVHPSGIGHEVGEVLQGGKIQHKAPDGSILISDEDAFVAGRSVVVRKQ
jgi:hypothetical protein